LFFSFFDGDKDEETTDEETFSVVKETTDAEESESEIGFSFPQAEVSLDQLAHTTATTGYPFSERVP
jgi:hypothetical protein